MWYDIKVLQSRKQQQQKNIINKKKLIIPLVRLKNIDLLYVFEVALRHEFTFTCLWTSSYN